MSVSDQGVPGAATAADAMTGRVEVKRLRKQFGDNVVLRETDLVVSPGEFFTLLGPSGSGKTTLLNIIAGFTPATSGEVHIDDARIDGLPAHRRNLGMVFQNYSLIPHMTVQENVAFPLSLRRVPRSEIPGRVREVLSLVRMDGTEHRRPAQLSGGQQQRIAIARALVFNPSVLLMDEPMSALDRNLRSELQLELRALQRRLGITVIFVTHDQEEALTMSDRIAVLHDGRANQVGPPAEIYERPNALFQAQFLGDSTTFEGTLEDVSGSRATVRATGGLVLSGRMASDDLGDRVLMNVRSERVRVSPAVERTPERPHGVISDVIYVGREIRYLVDTEFAGSLLVACPNAGGGARSLEPGTQVLIEWDPDDLACFSADSDS